MDENRNFWVTDRLKEVWLIPVKISASYTALN